MCLFLGILNQACNQEGGGGSGYSENLNRNSQIY